MKLFRDYLDFTRVDLVDINLLMGGGDGPDSSGGAESAMQQCVCVAWSKNNNWYEIESDQTTIRLACESPFLSFGFLFTSK